MDQDHPRSPFIERKNAIGSRIGAYLLGFAGGLLLYPFISYQAIAGYLLLGIGLLVTVLVTLQSASR